MLCSNNTDRQGGRVEISTILFSFWYLLRYCPNWTSFTSFFSHTVDIAYKFFQFCWKVIRYIPVIPKCCKRVFEFRNALEYFKTCYLSFSIEWSNIIVPSRCMKSIKELTISSSKIILVNLFFYVVHDFWLCKYFFYIRTDELEQEVKCQYHQKENGWKLWKNFLKIFHEHRE